MYTQWRDYGNWTNPETGEKLHESGPYSLSEAKVLAFANVIAGISEIKSGDSPDRRYVPSEFQHLVADNTAEQSDSEE